MELLGMKGMNLRRFTIPAIPASPFPRMFSEASVALDFISPDEQPKPPATKAKAMLFLQGPVKTDVVPLPKAFERALESEWKHPIHLMHNPKIINKLYTLPEPIMKPLPIHSVDVPVVAIFPTSSLAAPHCLPGSHWSGSRGVPVFLPPPSCSWLWGTGFWTPQGAFGVESERGNLTIDKIKILPSIEKEIFSPIWLSF